MPTSPVVAFSPGNQSNLDWRDRVISLSARHPAIFRAVAAGVEPFGDVNHVFGGLDSWYLLRAIRCRPTILTAVADGIRLEDRLYRHIVAYVAESPQLVRSLTRQGAPPDCVRLIYPGTDMSAFVPASAPEGRFRILFASWPEHREQLDKRGVFLLLELARQRPDIDVVLLVREWGNHAENLAALNAVGIPANVHIETLGCRSMADLYASVHAVAALFENGAGKSCPNSIVEGLACGRPALVSTECGIADTIGNRAGVVVPRAVEQVVEGVGVLQSSWTQLARHARALAEDTFSNAAFVRQYRDLYDGATTVRVR
jgi:glycosyltransferase involved in cell wall biosynthesis